MRERTSAGRRLVREERRPATVVARTLGIARSSLYRVLSPCRIRPQDPILAELETLCARHTRFGYRRITALLKRAGHQVNRKRVLRLMREQGFCVPRKRRRRPPCLGHIEVTGPNQLWQTDLTKVWCGQDGWGYLVAYIDCFTREVVGHSLASRCRTVEVLQPLWEALSQRFPDGEVAGLIIGHDNGSQFTSDRFFAELAALGIQSRRTGYQKPEQDAYIERFFGSLKDEEVWCYEYLSLAEAQASIAAWIAWYNEGRPHSALGYESPREYAARAGGLQITAA